MSLAAAAPASATVIDFEDLQNRNNFGDTGWNNWDTYQGYIWGWGSTGGVAGRTFDGADTGWASGTVTNPAYPPAPGNMSGTAYAWTWNGPQSLWINFQAATDVTSVDLATLGPQYWSNSLTVQLFGYDASNNLIGSTSVFALTDSFQTFLAGLSGVTYLELRSDRNSSWFSVDNLTVNENAVPESATWAMMFLGFGAIGFAMRKRRTAALAQIA